MENDPRFLAGIRHFNAREFFEAHEIWEELWHDCDRNDRRFVQSLIQAAVSIYHWEADNAAGAETLLQRGRAKAADYSPVYHGLPLARLWASVAETIRSNAAPPRIELVADFVPDPVDPLP